VDTLVGLVATLLPQAVIKLKENNEIENKNFLREGSFTFMTNTLALLSSPLIQDDHTPTVNIDTNPVLWRV
jgi:hypothetical protein